MKAAYYMIDEYTKVCRASEDKKALRLFKAQRPPEEEADSGEGRQTSSLPDNAQVALLLRRETGNKSLRISTLN
jgi:hypothetical protein